MAKKAFKRLNVDLGNAGLLSVDLNKQTDNDIISIPLFSSNYSVPVNLSLVLALSEKNTLYPFGYGTNISYYAKLSVSSNYLKIIYADTTSETFYESETEENKYLSSSSSNYIINGSNYELHINETIYYYNKSTLMEYPERIKTKEGFEYTITLNSNNKIYKITNNLNEEIRFNHGTNSITIVVYRTISSSEKLTTRTMHLLYESSYLSEIRMKNYLDASYKYTSGITIGTNVIITDMITGRKYVLEYTTSGKNIKSVYNTQTSTYYTITYVSDYLTRVTDRYGDITYYGYAGDNRIDYECDSLGNVIGYGYKQVISGINVYEDENLLETVSSVQLSNPNYIKNNIMPNSFFEEEEIP